MSAVPDAAGRPLPDRSGVTARHGGECCVQERAVAIRADTARRRGLHTVRQLLAAGHRAAARRGPGAVLGDPIGRVPETGRRPPPTPRRRPPGPLVGRPVAVSQQRRRRRRRARRTRTPGRRRHGAAVKASPPRGAERLNAEVVRVGHGRRQSAAVAVDRRPRRNLRGPVDHRLRLFVTSLYIIF